MEIIKNMNRRGGKFFYVAYRGDEWVAKIYYNKKQRRWLVEYEVEAKVTDEELIEIIKFQDKKNVMV